MNNPRVITNKWLENIINSIGTYTWFGQSKITPPGIGVIWFTGEKKSKNLGWKLRLLQLDIYETENGEEEADLFSIQVLNGIFGEDNTSGLVELPNLDDTNSNISYGNMVLRLQNNQGWIYVFDKNNPEKVHLCLTLNLEYK